MLIFMVLFVGMAFLVMGSGQAVAKKHLSKKTISLVQSQLKDLGYYKGEITGALDEATTQAIKDFQKASKLKVDGIPGKKTRRALTRAVKALKAKKPKSGQ